MPFTRYETIQNHSGFPWEYLSGPATIVLLIILGWSSWKYLRHTAARSSLVGLVLGTEFRNLDATTLRRMFRIGIEANNASLVDPYLDYLEYIACAMKYTGLDSRTYRAWRSHELVIVWRSAREYVIKKRHRDQLPSLYSELDTLANRWSILYPQPLTIELKKGDIVFTRGYSFLSRTIRIFTRKIGESRTMVNHVGIVVDAGSDPKDTIIVEALKEVREHSLCGQYRGSKNDIAIYRNTTLNTQQRDSITKAAKEYVGKLWDSQDSTTLARLCTSRGLRVSQARVYGSISYLLMACGAQLCKSG